MAMVSLVFNRIAQGETAYVPIGSELLKPNSCERSPASSVPSGPKCAPGVWMGFPVFLEINYPSSSKNIKKPVKRITVDFPFGTFFFHSISSGY
jgi:hypothetical protein